MQGKQAKIVSPTQERAILGYLVTTRYPARDRVMFLLSMKAGLRAKEMASLTWAMVTDAAGQVAEVLHIPNRARKGKTGGRTIPLHPDLQAALVMLQTARADMATPERPILFSERGGGLSPATVRLWFHRLYTSSDVRRAALLWGRGRPRRPTHVMRRRRGGCQSLELPHDLPGTPHGKLRQGQRSSELLVVVRAIACAPQLAQAVSNRPVERACALAIVRDHPLMGLSGRGES
jgi:integrase